MNKMFGCAAIFMMAFGALFGKTVKEFPEVTQVVDLTELTADLTKEILNGNRPEIAVFCKEGAEFPLKLFSKNDLFSFQFQPNLTFRSEKSYYFRVIGKRVFSSENLVDWVRPDKTFLGGRTDTNIAFNKGEVVIELVQTPYEDDDFDDDFED